MIRRSTWALVAVFVLLLAGTLVYQRYQDQQPKAEATSTPDPNGKLFTIDEKTIVSLRIEGAGKAVQIGRDSSGLWTVTEPKGGPTDAGKVESAMSQLVDLGIIATLNPTTDLNVYGLGKAAYIITVGLNDGTKDVANVGSLTPTSSGYYVRLNDQTPKVVSKFSLDALLGLLENPPFQDTPTPAAGTPAPATGTPAAETPASPTGAPTAAPSSTPLPAATGTATP